VYKSLGNYKNIAEKVKKLVQEEWKNTKIYLFGSILKGKYTGASDIDILIVSDEKIAKEEEYRIKAKIYKNINAPIELHITTQKEYENWYKKFVKEEIVEV